MGLIREVFLDFISRVDVWDFYDPDYLLQLRSKLKGCFLLETSQGEQWHQLEFSKIETSPYSRVRLFLICPGCKEKTISLYDCGQLLCRRCLDHEYMSTGCKEDDFYRKVLKPVQEVMSLEDRMKRRIPATKKEKLEKDAVGLIREIVDQTIEEWEQWLWSFWNILLSEYSRHLKRSQYLQSINREWSELMALGPDTDPHKQIMAMKSINKKIRMMGEI